MNKEENKETTTIDKKEEPIIQEQHKNPNTSQFLDKKKSNDLKITFGPINRNNYEQLKQLNNMTLPVRYGNGFYLRISHGLRFGRFAYYNDIIVGAISWKYDVCENVKSIYLMTISVLDEYRRYGIGSRLLKEMIRIHSDLKEVSYINLHVQVNNEVALKFYEKHQFKNEKFLESYYTGVEIDPKDAYYLRFFLHKDDTNNDKNDKDKEVEKK